MRNNKIRRIILLLVAILMLGSTLSACVKKIPKVKDKATEAPIAYETEAPAEDVSLIKYDSLENYPKLALKHTDLKSGIDFTSEIEGKYITRAYIYVPANSVIRKNSTIEFSVNGTKVGEYSRENENNFVDITDGLKTLLKKGQNNIKATMQSGTSFTAELYIISNYIVACGDLTITGVASKTVSEALFGNNIEITREAWWKSLSAEMLNNRKFFKEDSGKPAGWQMSKGTYVKDTANSICSSNYVTLSNGGTLVYSSESMALEGGETYTIKVWASSGSRLEIQVNGKKVGTGPVDSNGLLSFEYTAESTTSTGNFAIKNVGSDASIYVVSMMNKDNFYGMRKDVVEKLKTLGPSSLRYPGGCAADRWDWENAIKNPENRKPMEANESGLTGMGSFLFTATYDTDPLDFGLVEFFKLCEYIGCKAELTVSLVRGDSQTAANLVKYCKDNNYEVATWFVGNEVYYFGGIYYQYPKKAANRVDKYIKAMREVDKNIKICIGICNTTDEMHQWTIDFMNTITEKYDYLSVHDYYGAVETETDYYKASNIVRGTSALQRDNTFVVIDAINFMNSIDPEIMKNCEIYIDEWNWGFDMNPTGPFMIGNAKYLINIINTAKDNKLAAASFFHPLETMIEADFGKSEFTGAGYVFTLMTNHTGEQYLNYNFELSNASIVVTKGENNITISCSNLNNETIAIKVPKNILNTEYSKCDTKSIVSNDLSFEKLCLVSNGAISLKSTYVEADSEYFYITVPGMSFTQAILK